MPDEKHGTWHFGIPCRADDIEEFHLAAEHEGFGSNVTAWALWHLRRDARESREHYDGEILRLGRQKQ